MSRARRAALGLAGALLACGPAEPAPLVRVVAAAPSGDAVPPEAVRASVSFSAPVAPDGLVDGRRLVLVPAELVRDALAAVESDGGAAGLPGTVAVDAVLAEGGTCAVLGARAPLRARSAYALVLSSRARGADGRAVLDPEGKQRPFVARFQTSAAAGPPPRPVLTEVLADAETPEAGGEYVEIANLGEAPLELAGWRLAKRTASGALSSCLVAGPPGAAVAPGAAALVGGGAWDSRYALPAGTPVFTCGSSSLLGGIANDRAPELSLLDPSGALASSLGAGGVAPLCAEALVRIRPDGPDAAENLACAEPSPGAW